MRISTNTLFDTNVNQLNTLQSNLLQVNQQIATGRRMLTPADDPAGAARALQVTQTAAINTQYMSNIGTTTDSVSLAEGTLQGVNSLLISIQSTAISANNSAYSNADRKSLANTLQANLSHLLSMANATDATGNYLFSGFKGATQPFVQTSTGVQYNGDDGQRLIQVSSTQQLAASDSGADVFMRIKNGNGTFVAGPSVTGSNIFANATAASASVTTPLTLSTAPATFTVDGTPVTVNSDVSVAGNGTGPGTLAEAIQSGLTAAGLATYTVSTAPNGGLQINNSVSPTPVAITNINDPLGSLGPAINNGSGVISAGSVSNPPPTADQLRNTYQITFAVAAGGATTYTITGTDQSGATLPASSLPAPATGLPYTSGQAITFNGIQFDIQGAPHNGDTFTVKPSSNESLFSTISNLISTLNATYTGGTLSSSALQAAGINHALNSLNNALNSVLTAQASQGSRLNQLKALSDTGSFMDAQYKQTLSNLQDLDYNKALSDLTQQKTTLTAAQQSFVQIENLSMFNYLR